MTEIEICRLVEDIDTVDFREFWWGSGLLDRASKVSDPRVIASLLRRHQCLSNKEAFSAHVLRATIATLDGPEFRILWSTIDSENDSQRLLQEMENPLHLPWAAAYVIGEVGGATALRAASLRLSPQHQARHFLIVRVVSHLVVRYLMIQNEGVVTSTIIDLKTREVTRHDPVSAESEAYKMERLRRKQANEYFTPVELRDINELKAGLDRIPDSLLNIKRQVFLGSINKVPTRAS